jgi:hypothetical protein
MHGVRTVADGVDNLALALATLQRGNEAGGAMAAHYVLAGAEGLHPQLVALAASERVTPGAT